MKLSMQRSVGRSALSLLAVSGLVGGVGCQPEVDDRDRTPPRVVGVSPGDPVLPVTAALQVTFSEKLDPATVDDDPTSDTVTVLLVPRAAISEAFLTDFKSPGIIESRQDDVIAIDAELRNDTVEIVPEQPLQPNTAYVLLLGADLRDTAANPLVDGLGLAAVFRYDFQTDAGSPEVTATDLGTGTIAPNRRRFDVTFNQPVRNVGTSTLTLSPAVDIEAVLLDETRTVATVFVAAPSSGCARFVPNTEYTLNISNAVVADTGQALVPYAATFSTGASCDTVEHVVVGAPEAIAGETSATIRFTTNKPSTTLVRFGLDGGELDCLGAACPIAGASVRTPSADSSPPAFVHALQVSGLEVDRTYRFVVSAEDDVGTVASGSGSFITAPLPKVSVNEVMANPSSVFTSEARGEYVELANFGTDVLDVSGWLVHVDGGDAAGGCTATLPAATTIAAGAFLVVGGKDFDAAPYALEADVVVVKLSKGSSNGMCSLVNSRAQPVVLADAAGRPVSSVGGYASLIPDNDGRSVERIGPEVADVESSFCFSRTDAGPSPGRANSITVGGCDD
jgi:hypothetical protein